MYEATAVIETLAGRFADEVIASILNRLRLKTGTDKTWTEERVKGVRFRKKLPAYTLDQAAQHLSLSPPLVLRLIDNATITATQLVPCAPWLIPALQLDTLEVQRAADAIRQRLSPEGLAPRSKCSTDSALVRRATSTSKYPWRSISSQPCSRPRSRSVAVISPSRCDVTNELCATTP